MVERQPVVSVLVSRVLKTSSQKKNPGDASPGAAHDVCGVKSATQFKAGQVVTLVGEKSQLGSSVEYS
jgi:hypothetical protein